MAEPYDHENPPEARDAIPVPVSVEAQPILFPAETVRRHRGDAYGWLGFWLGFWLAVGILIGVSILAVQWDHATKVHTRLICGETGLSNGVCGGPDTPTTTTIRSPMWQSN